MLRANRIRQYARLMSERGFTHEELFRGTHVDPDRLSDSAYLLNENQCRSVILRMLDLSGDPGLGLEVGQHCHLVDLGVTGCAAMTSPTMRHAMALWASYAKSLVGILSQLSITATSKSLTFRVTEPLLDDPLCVFCTEELLSIIYTLGGELAERPPAIRKISLGYPAPPHAARYERLFCCPVTFQAQATTVALDDAWLDSPRSGSDAGFNSICLQYFGNAMGEMQAREPLSTQLVALFLKSPDRLPNLEVAANRLRVSPRTLRRHLSAEGTSYRELSNSFRAQLAKDYLTSQLRKPKEIAYLLGFDDQHSFHRAFKHWTGQTTRQFKQGALREIGDSQLG
jgi:AraC-like DNA-binding protein